MPHPDKLSDLHVLMLGLSDGVLARWGDVQERHLDYARKIGHLHMVVYSPRHKAQKQTALSEHLTVYPTASRSRPGFILDAYRISSRIIKKKPIHLITTQDPFTTGLVGARLKKRFGIPLQIQNHSEFFDNPYWLGENRFRHRLFNLAGKRVIKKGDSHRVVNQAEKDKYIRMGISEERILVLPVPPYLDRFTSHTSPLNIRQTLNLKENELMLLWVGKPGPVKRVSFLIKAFEQIHQEMPSAHLVLVGDFSRQSDIQARVNQLKLSELVHFAGTIAHDELPSYYQACDLYVHSSSYEGFGLVMAEASASGKAIVSTATAGAKMIVQNGETGYLADLSHPSDLAQKAILLLRNPDQRSSMGEAGQAFVLETYDRDKALQGIIDSWLYTVEVAQH